MPHKELKNWKNCTPAKKFGSKKNMQDEFNDYGVFINLFLTRFKRVLKMFLTLKLFLTLTTLLTLKQIVLT